VPSRSVRRKRRPRSPTGVPDALERPEPSVGTPARTLSSTREVGGERRSEGEP
jgi:hypothetical protein